jgi:N-acetylglucosamine kinase-like BadF-type ATPase
MARTRDVMETQPHLPMSGLLLAVDAGGTKTSAWLVDTSRAEEDRILGRGRSTSGNPLSVGIAESTRSIAEATRLAREDAGHLNENVSRAILSVAGAANREMSERLIHWARENRLAEHVAIVSDVLPVLAGGTPRCCGVALISGTGSSAFGRGADGQTALCGGWGYLLGDEGSGYAIGRAGLQLVLRTLEAKTPPKPLAEVLLKPLNVKAVTELTKRIYSDSDTRRAIAAVAPLVIAAADAGDPQAQAILDSAAQHLARLVGRAAQAVGLAGGPFALAVGGGVLVSSMRLQEQLSVDLRRRGTECEMMAVNDALAGCVRLADAEFAGTLVNWREL